MTRPTDHAVSGAGRSKGQEIVQGLRELADVLKAGKPLEARFTVRTYKITAPPEYINGDVRRVRDLLGMSQAAFAAFLGVDPSTVRSWEQGLRRPSPLACRILSEMEADPDHWRQTTRGGPRWPDTPWTGWWCGRKNRSRAADTDYRENQVSA